MNNCVLKVRVITYNDIHLLINPMYLNIAVLFISEMPATLSYTGKLVSVIKSKLSWLNMSVCKLDCNEDIFVKLYEYLPLLPIILNNTLMVYL